jgi:hypothetical protein
MVPPPVKPELDLPATVRIVNAGGRPAAPSRPHPRVEGDPIFGNGGRDFEQVEHLVWDDEPDTALCGVDQTDVPWNQGWPLCEACRAVAEGRVN